MSIPSVIFADANWYGSLRGGVEFGGGADGVFKDTGSRWGIKGSNELSDGLSAVYRFEHKFSTADASQAGGRLAYVGLSGGFGSLSLGQIWSASFNHVGGMTDLSWAYGNSHTSYRVPSAVSYSISAGMASLQIDAIMDGKKDSGDAVDQVEFGMSFDLGDIGKVGLAYVDSKNHMVTSEKFMKGTPPTVTAGTPTTVTAGTPTTVTAGTPGTPSTQRFISVDVMSGNFDLMVNEETGVLEVAEDVTWTANNITDQKTDSVENKMHKAWVELTSGAIIAAPTTPTATQKEVELMPTIVYHSSSPTNNQVPISAYKKVDDGYELIGAAGCDVLQNDETEGNECTAFARFVLVYRDADATGTVDQETGAITVPQSLAIYDADGDNISHTATYMHPDGINEGTPNTPTVVTPGTPPVVTPGTPPTIEPGTPSHYTKVTETEYGSRDTHIAAQFNLGAVSAHLGHSQMESNKPMAAKQKVTHYGVSGGLGDTGLSFHLMARNKNYESASEGENPWLVGLTKSLGDGASFLFEHGNPDTDDSGKTRLGLKVDF